MVDFSRLLPGPYATLVLADLGADVIKIEAPKGGDYIRWMPPLAGPFSYAFSALNSGKRSIALDLKAPDGVEVARRLAADCDILIESFRPGVMARLGLGYDALRARNARLIYCAISGFGQDGPYRDRPGHDLNYAAIGGAIGLAGPADGPPAVPPIQMADIGGSLWSLVAVLAALQQRHVTGEGAYLDVSMTDCVTGFLQAGLAAHLGGAAPPPKRGADTLTGGQACYGVYETSDQRYFAVAPLEPKFWAAMCAALDRPDLRKRHYGDAGTHETLAALFKTKTRAEWEGVFDGSGACCHPVLAPDELAAHPLHVARGNVIKDASGIARLKTPIRDRAAPPPGAAPGLGEHTRAILTELGYAPDVIDALVASKTVAGA